MDTRPFNVTRMCLLGGLIKDGYVGSWCHYDYRCVEGTIGSSGAQQTGWTPVTCVMSAGRQAGHQ